MAVQRDEAGLVVLYGADTKAVVKNHRGNYAALRLSHAALHTAGHVLGFAGEDRGWQHKGHVALPWPVALGLRPGQR